MRVGRPLPAPLEPLCDYCGAKVRLVRPGNINYPYQADHGPLWICGGCQAWIGMRARSRQHAPLGRLANAELRDAKSRLHDALEPLVQAKVRRDGANVFEARGKAMKWLIAALGIEVPTPSIHTLTLEQCETAIGYLANFRAAKSSRIGDAGI